MPAELTEGSTYLIKATTTNMSTKAGVPVAATLTVNIAAVVNSQIIMEDSEVYGFAADETHTFEFSMAVPMGTGGKAGAVVAEVLDPNGNKLADGSLDVVIAPAAPPPIEFAYVSEITQGSCKIGIYSARSCEVDVQNLGSVAGECTLKVYANQYYNYTWKGWYDTGKVLKAIIQPGEVVTFSACMFAMRAYTFSYKVRFVGDPGTIESIKFTIRRYA